MESAKYFNLLNILHKCDYKQLQKIWEGFQDWKKAWQKEKTALDAEKEWQKLKNLNIAVILKEDKNYPPLLKEIASPPFGIYVLGQIEYTQPVIAIVGTRAATPQGKEIAYNFAYQLSGAGFTIVSGLAMGIDENSHQGALDGKGKTIAVLGTALDNIYPKQNQRLAKRILEAGGAIISEFPLGQEYRPQNFLIRNRIISGLTQAALIIEAPEKSGALATARFALEQNRDVFAIPGGITAKNYQGSNRLIRDGAALITQPKDILEYFGVQETPSRLFSSQYVDEDENKVISTLKESGKELSIDELLTIMKTDVGQLNKNLATLVVKGIIKEVNGKYLLN